MALKVIKSDLTMVPVPVGGRVVGLGDAQGLPTAALLFSGINAAAQSEENR